MPNFTCPIEHHPEEDPVPFLSNGNIHFKAHDVGWLACGVMALISCTASFWLVWKHLTYYTCPPQQRHIVRMLFMVPIYSLVSFASYIFYRQALYYQVIRDCYEAVTITSFFLLLLQYVGDTPEEQHIVFRKVKLQKWFWPLGSWKYRPDGLKFLWLMKICILQYAVFRPLCTILTVGMEYMGVYCLASWMPWFGHLWMALVITISVSVAMYCVVQFYLPIAEELKPYEPVLKFLAVKAVVFLTFWQESFLALLISFGAIKNARYWTAHEIAVGLGALLACFEMVIFAFVHIKAFSYKPYCPTDTTRTTRRLRAFGHVLDFRDWFKHMKQSSKWAAANRKGQDFTLVNEIRARKYDHLMKAMGKDRTADLQELRDQRREQKQARFWAEPGDRPWLWHNKDAESEGGTDAKGPKVIATRPDGGLYTVAELRQQAKLASKAGSEVGPGAEKTRSRDGSQYGGSEAGSAVHPSKNLKPNMDELRRLTSVLDEPEDDFGDEDDEQEEDVAGAGGRSTLLRSSQTGRRGRHGGTIQDEDEDEIDEKAAVAPGPLGTDQHPELSAYHTAYPLRLALDLHSPESDSGKGFAEEMEDEYKALGLWRTLSHGGRGQYALTGQHDEGAAGRNDEQRHGKQRSWWRAFRDRISGSGVDDAERAEGTRRVGAWPDGHMEAQGGEQFAEPAWLETTASRPSFGGTFPGRRSSLAVGLLYDSLPVMSGIGSGAALAPATKRVSTDATGAVTEPVVVPSFVRVSGRRESDNRLPTSPTSPGQEQMQIPRKPVPVSTQDTVADKQAAPVVAPPADVPAPAAQPWLFEQRQSPLSKLITSQVQARDSSLQPTKGSSGPDSVVQGSKASPTEMQPRPVFHPARPVSFTRSIASGSSNGHGTSSPSMVDGPLRNKSMSASVRFPSETGTFGRPPSREPTMDEDGALAGEDFHSAHSESGEPEQVERVMSPPAQEPIVEPEVAAPSEAPVERVQAVAVERPIAAVMKRVNSAAISSKQGSLSRCTSPGRDIAPPPPSIQQQHHHSQHQHQLQQPRQQRHQPQQQRSSQAEQEPRLQPQSHRHHSYAAGSSAPSLPGPKEERLLQFVQDQRNQRYVPDMPPPLPQQYHPQRSYRSTTTSDMPPPPPPPAQQYYYHHPSMTGSSSSAAPRPPAPIQDRVLQYLQNQQEQRYTSYVPQQQHRPRNPSITWSADVSGSSRRGGRQSLPASSNGSMLQQQQQQQQHSHSGRHSGGPPRPLHGMPTSIVIPTPLSPDTYPHPSGTGSGQGNRRWSDTQQR